MTDAPADSGTPGEPSGSIEPGDPSTDGWAAAIAGVVETVVATRGPEGRWNQAALGIEPTADGGSVADGRSIAAGSTEPARAESYGQTLTRRNVERTATAYVQHTVDPRDIVEAALGVYQTVDPILASAAAWTRVDVERVGVRDADGTEVVAWALHPREGAVTDHGVPTLDRGRAATVEATVHASRLDVEGYETAALLDRLEHLSSVVEATGDRRTRLAFERIDDLVGWRDRSA